MSLLESCYVSCPYCGEDIELIVDATVAEQYYIEDCPVCCRPINILAIVDDSGVLTVSVTTDTE